MTEHRYRRPSFQEPAALEALGERVDPIGQVHAAHESAAVLLHAGRAADDPEVTERLVALVDEIGLVTLADLWAARPARSLPGALYRIYLLHQWMLGAPDEVAREYAAGVRITEPHHDVAGAAPPGPDEERQVADETLRGVFTGDFGLALERAAAFCQVVVAGRTDLARGPGELVQAHRLHRVAHDLRLCAQDWRAGDLH
ncbi:MAG: hypothetical protein Q4G45_06705 [Actinomycetia bacterium]|nr:hypothetical protein [Actinomycetes bacterium]